jgi:hypothetical protein
MDQPAALRVRLIGDMAAFIDVKLYPLRLMKGDAHVEVVSLTVPGRIAKRCLPACKRPYRKSVGHRLRRMLPFCKYARIRLVVPLLGILTLAAQPAPDLSEGCPERPRCQGCGCAGGPGYRAPDGRCVGFLELERKCGAPPTVRCTFENAPGTGANAECATRSRRHPRPHGVVDPD